MRSINKWAGAHRAGFRRAHAIVDRQDREHPTPIPGEPKRFKRDREMARRKAQIERGYLTAANGLAVTSAKGTS